MDSAEVLNASPLQLFDLCKRNERRKTLTSVIVHFKQTTVTATLNTFRIHPSILRQIFVSQGETCIFSFGVGYNINSKILNSYTGLCSFTVGLLTPHTSANSIFNTLHSSRNPTGSFILTRFACWIKGEGK